ncbi:UDP-glucuronosyltransferase 1-1-like [Phasianus colchicus]|uniref:UDP-glucuronosyltransferase 1-1-like n=1 Tax=Phasianus colchicus TaxID=9054 RepID=UPI00129EAA69|nr:UDP-glucuronosyltransferase 1-1-like [Phasianus colchicus]
MALVPPSHAQVSVLLLLLLSVLSLAAGGKLLVVFVDGSPWFSVLEMLEILKQKGHEIVVVAPEANISIKPSENVTVKTYPVTFPQEEIDENFHTFLMTSFEEGSLLERFFRLREYVKKGFDLGFISCEQLLYNKELIRYLEESNFDALLTDPILSCGAILSEHLSIPSVYFMRLIPCGLDFEATQCPNPPSYIPRLFTDHTDHMNFLQRVKNVIFDTSNFFLCDFIFKPFEKLASEFLQRDVTMLDLFHRASVWLLRYDFVLDYPRPLMPNMIVVGGVNCAHKQLPQVGCALFLILILIDFCTPKNVILYIR